MQKGKKKFISLSRLSNVVQLYDQAFDYRYNQSGVIDMYLKKDLADVVHSLGGLLSVRKEHMFNQYSKDDTVLIGTYDFFAANSESPIVIAQSGWNLILITSTDRQYDEAKMYEKLFVSILTERQVQENPTILVNRIVANSDI